MSLLSIIVIMIVYKKLNERVHNMHKPMSYCVYIVTDSGVLPVEPIERLHKEPYIYRGDAAANKCILYIIEVSNWIGELFKSIMKLMLPLTEKKKKKK